MQSTKCTSADDVAISAFEAHTHTKISHPAWKNETPEKKDHNVPTKKSSLSIFIVGFISGLSGFFIFEPLPIEQLFLDSQSSTNQYIVTDNTPIRRGPSLSYNQVGSAETGRIITSPTKANDQWIRLDYGQYVNTQKLEKIRYYTDPPKIVLKRDLGKKDIFEHAHKLAKKIGYIKLTKGMVLRKVRIGWYQLPQGSYVHFPRKQKSVQATVIEDKAQIYFSPSNKSEVVGAFFKGKKLQVLPIDKQWVRIGRQQYVTRKALKMKLQK